MLKSGDKIIAKPKFLFDFKIPYEHREVEVLFSDGVTTAITNRYIQENIKGGEIVVWANSVEHFYLSHNINYEIMKLIDQGVEFKEFNAVTMDDKIIDIRMGLKR
jgi:hypothetical protein